MAKRITSTSSTFREDAPQPRIETLAISEITVDESINVRQCSEDNTIGEYADRMQEGDVFPPLDVFGDAHLVADGFLRISAAKQAELKALVCRVHVGGRREALLFAARANVSHGLPRTNADKRAAVLRLLSDEEWRKWSDREIAKQLGVSNTLVSEMRADLSAADSEDRTRRFKTKHGTTSTMATGNIGRVPYGPKMPPADGPPLRIVAKTEPKDPSSPVLRSADLQDALDRAIERNERDACRNAIIWWLHAKPEYQDAFIREIGIENVEKVISRLRVVH
jgi:hypothetical protein